MWITGRATPALVRRSVLHLGYDHHVPTDPESEAVLSELTAAGQNKTDAIKAALIMAARARRHGLFRAEAAALAADPEDLAEIRAVREEMDDLRAW